MSENKFSTPAWNPLAIRNYYLFVRGNVAGFETQGGEKGVNSIVGPNHNPGGYPDSPAVIAVAVGFGAAAQPGNIRAIDSELLFNFAGSTTLTAGQNIAAVRGCVSIAAPTTIIGSSYLFGAQGKVIVQGTLANTGGNGIIAAGIFGQLDLSNAVAISSPLTAGWFDIGASASAALVASYVPGTPGAGILGAASRYGILAAAGITNTGSTVVAPPAVIGSFPTTTITFDGGTATVDNTDAAQAHIDALAAYNYYSGLTFSSLGGALDLSTSNGSGGNTYTPGNYSFGAATCSVGIVLNGAGTYIFKGSSTISLANAQTVSLTGGATLANTTVIWLVGSSMTLGTTTTMIGTILANTSITLNGGTLNGRAIAGVVTSSGAVTISAALALTVSNAGTPATGGPTNIDITTLYNTTTAVINSAFRVISNSSFLFDLSGNVSSPWLTTGSLSIQSKKIAVNIDGQTYYIPLYVG